MKNNNTPKRRAAAPRSERRPRPAAPTLPFALLLLAAGLLALVFLSWRYNLRRAAPPEVEVPNHLVINEVATDDQTQLEAPDTYCHSWVELYNPTSEAVALDGWSLSNKKTDLRRYTFPKGLEVESGGRLLCWCTGTLNVDPLAAMEESGVPFADYTVRRGDTLCLSQDGVVVDTVELPGTLQKDMAFGRTTDGGVTLAAIDPTPEEANEAVRIYSPVEQPILSAPSGFYDDPFELSITAPEGCTVYYTLDSSVPTTESTPYTGPITVEDATPNPNVYALNQKQSFYSDTPLYPGQEPIYDNYYCPYLLPKENLDKCTVVRAVAVDAEGNVSDAVTASYFVGFQGRKAYEDLPVVSLVSDPDDLFGDRGILVTGKVYEDKLADGSITTKTYWGSLRRYTNLFRKGSAWERSAHLDYFNADKSLSFSQEAGIRNHGNASRKRVPKAFSLYAREKYDGRDRFQQPFFGNNTLTDKAFLVNGAAVRRYALVNRMDERGTDTQDYQLAQVFLDGEYWGFYAVQEAYNSSTYMADHYGLGGDDAILLKANSVQLINVTGTEEDIENEYNPLMDFVGSHDMTEEENWEKLNTMMDVQSFVDLYAANLYLCNMDFNWHHNIYVFKSRKVSTKNPYADGRWHWMLYDVDYSTGDNSNVLVDHNMFQGNFLNRKHGLALDPIFPHLAKNEHFREMFVNTYLDLANDVYGASEMSALMGQFQEKWREAAYATVLRYPLKADSETLDPETHGSRFQANCDKLAEFFQERFECDAPHMADYFNLTGKQVTVTLEGSEGGSIGLNTLTPDLSKGDWSGVYYTDVPVRLTALPEMGKKLDHWEINTGEMTENEDGTASLKLNGDVTVRAVFTADDTPAEETVGDEP